MPRNKVSYGCQLKVMCCKEVDHELLEEHHVIPKAWAERHPEAESRIKGGRNLKLLLCPNCHKWLHKEMNTKLGKDPSEEEMHKFVSWILSKLCY